MTPPAARPAQYVETLQEQLADLQSAGRVEDGLLRRYRHAARALADQLERADVPAFCRLAAAAAAAPPRAPPGGGAPAPADRHRVPAAVAPVLVPRLPPPAAAPPPRPVPVSDAARGRLAAQGQVQEVLTDELADMAAALKGSTLAMEGRVRERATLLDSTEEALERSLAGTKAAGAKAAAVHRRGRVNFCFTLLVMLIIGVGFAAMYLFIRVTSFTGYRSPRGAAPAPPPPPPPPLVPDPGGGAALDPGAHMHVEL
jgi:hypothetical protein